MTAQDAEFYQAIGKLKDELLAAIANATASLHANLTVLTEMHHTSVLQQEQRNQTFADRDRLEIVSSRTHEIANRLTENLLRTTTLERAIDSLTAAINAANDKSTSIWSTFLGYAVSGLIAGASLLIGFLLTRPHP